jgi:hypothetical protein
VPAACVRLGPTRQDQVCMQLCAFDVWRGNGSLKSKDLLSQKALHVHSLN